MLDKVFGVLVFLVVALGWIYGGVREAISQRLDNPDKMW